MPKSPRKYLRGAFALLALVLAPTIVLVLIALFVLPSSLVSDPATPRSWAQAEQSTLFFKDGDAIPPAEILGYIFFDVTDNEYQLIMPQYMTLKNFHFPVDDIVQIRLGETATVPEGEIAISRIGSYITSNPPPRMFDQVAMPLFHPDLSPLTNDELARLGQWQDKITVNSYLPQLRMDGDLKGIEYHRALRSRVYDARTHVRIDTTPSSSYHNILSDWKSTRRWHQGPVRWVIDFSHGPAIEATIDATTTGTVTMAGDIPVKYFGVYAGRQGSFSEIPINNDSYARSYISLDIPKGIYPLSLFRIGREEYDSPGAMAFFASGNTDLWSRLEVEVLLKNGVRTKLYDSGVRGVFEIDAPPDEIVSFVVKFSPRVTRLIVDIPEIPGLPEMNQTVENLWDVSIPYIDFSGLGEMLIFLAQATQLDLIQDGAKGQTIPFTPQSYINTTPRKLLREYHRHFTRPPIVSVDRETQTLIIKANKEPEPKVIRLLRMAWNDLKQIF